MMSKPTKEEKELARGCTFRSSTHPGLCTSPDRPDLNHLARCCYGECREFGAMLKEEMDRAERDKELERIWDKNHPISD
jgi:hypothetical protein